MVLLEVMVRHDAVIVFRADFSGISRLLHSGPAGRMMRRAGSTSRGDLMDLEVRAFGPMEIVRGGTATRLGSRRQRVLLATLLLRRGGAMSVSALAEVLWPAKRPANVENSVRIHVHRLRRTLGAATVQLRPPGYALAVSPATVDIYRFEELAQRGRTTLINGDGPAAVELLRQAVALHRGPAFHGLEDVVELAIESRRLDELRLAALEDRISAELAPGGGAELVSELDALVAAHPLRERFRAQLMTALYRAGRKADALAAYRAGRKLLVSELGVEPNGECQALERAILADDPALLDPGRPAPVVVAAAPPPPRQLPADVPAFTGRVRPLGRLDELLDHPATGVVCALEGMAGVGKTALALHWAHRVASRFPDGQLYVNLRGYSPGVPLRPLPVLAQFLRSLGVPDSRVPTDLAEAAAAYRSLLAGRRVLVVLDNAADPEQVRPLLPGGAGCVTLVTSRSRLAGLVAQEGAAGLALDVLPDDEAVALLVRVLGRAPVEAEPAAVAELVRRCAGLPLALRIAAANLATRPGLTVAGYVAQLRGTGELAALTVAGDGQAAVRAAFDLSYRRVPEPAGRMFRLIGLAFGPDLSAEAAAALAGVPVADGREHLAALATAHLVEEHTPGRYLCHDLLRAYAAERVRLEESPADREAARDRLYRYYLDGAVAADRLLYPHQLRPPAAGPGADPSPARFAGADPAGRWLDAEWQNLAAAVHSAAADRRDVAWRLGNALRGYVLPRVSAAEAGPLMERVCAAAETAGQPAALGQALLCLSGIRFQQGRGQQAVDDLARALAAFRADGWAAGEGAVLSNLATVHLHLGQPREALRCYTDARALYRKLGSGAEPPTIAVNLGLVLVDLGRLTEAVAHARRVAAVFADPGQESHGGHSFSILGMVHRLLGEFGPALRWYSRALSRYREIGDTTGEAIALRGLAEIHCDTGELAAALELGQASLRLAREIGHDIEEAETLLVLALVHQSRSDPPAADRDSRQALALARQMSNRRLVAESLLCRALGYRSAGGHRAADTCLRDALRIARAASYRLLEGRVLTAAAANALAAGDLARAVRDGEQALAIHGATGHRPGAADTHAVLGRASRRAGADVAAADHDRQARALYAWMGLRADPAHGFVAV
jgi:DNA-binding SARP family transcriptional activator/tetratricopeptide (TPR) repeat protein